MNTTTEQFGRVLAKYSLSRPLSPDDQRYILMQRKAALTKLLRQKGAYGAFFMTFLGIKIFFNKFGISLSLVQSKIIACMTAASISAGSLTGAYTAARYVKLRMDEASRPAEKPAASEKLPIRMDTTTAAPRLTTDIAIRKFYNKLEQVDLDDGTRLVGAVIYQDARTVRVHTIHGIIEIPVTGIRSIRIR
jgi:hypothetical protein